MSFLEIFGAVHVAIYVLIAAAWSLGYVEFGTIDKE